MGKVKCEICGKKIYYSESYGRETFIVCPMCHIELVNRIQKDLTYHFSASQLATEIILDIGYMKEGKEIKK